MPYTSVTNPTIDSTAPTGSSAGFDGSFDVGMRNTLADERDHDDRQVHEEDRAPVEVLDEETAADRTERGRDACDRGPQPDGAAALLGRERCW